MSFRLLAVSLALSLVGVGLITYKVAALGYELSPQPAPDRWSVQTEVRVVRPEPKARISFLLPADNASQRVYDERVSAEGMRFFIRPRDDNRIGVAIGQPEDGQRLTYRFSVQTRTSPPTEPVILPASTRPLGDEERKSFAAELGPEESIQSDAEAVRALLSELAIDPKERGAALQQIHDFVSREIVLTDGHDGPQDALSVLQRERGGSHGKARAEVALLRAAGIPARVVVGVPLAEGDSDVRHWVEAHLEDRWWPLEPVTGHAGAFPEERLILHVGDTATYEASGVERIEYKVSMLRERETQYQIFERRLANSDRLLDKLTLYSLPVKTQLLYRVLLLVPLGALVVAVFRNIVGVPTFGTFMPVLISLAFRDSGIAWGVLLLGIVVAIGYGGRWLLDRAQLLMVPRLSFLLTMVILIIAGVMVVAEHVGVRNATAIALFPIVIVTMTIERLSIAIVEEGPRNAMKLVLGTLVVSTCGYWVMSSEALQAFVFTFPEFHLVTMAFFLLLGRYTGYRLSEWTRFRAFRRGELEKAA